MKTIFLKLSILIASTIITFSCSKSDDSPPAPVAPVVYSEENFLDGYLTSSNFIQATANNINAGDYEFGSEFTPLVKGKITTLKVKLPDVRTNLRVTIWDKMAGTAIRTETINVAAANTVTVVDIIDLDLIKDKEYAITMNSNDWYDRRKTDGTSITYPITAGNIKINSYKWVSGTVSIYPTNLASNYYAGDLSFNFQRTE